MIKPHVTGTGIVKAAAPKNAIIKDRHDIFTSWDFRFEIGKRRRRRQGIISVDDF